MKTRELAKKAIQEQIALVALRHFQQDGFEKTTIEKISNEIGMSTRTFFRYFRSKEDVFLGPVQSFCERFLTSFDRSLVLKDIWASLEIALGENAFNCNELDVGELGTEMQVVIRSTPVLFARQLEIIERLQIDATDLYVSGYSHTNALNWSTTNAIIRSGFACLHAIQCSTSAGLKNDIARGELQKLMLNLRPNILLE